MLNTYFSSNCEMSVHCVFVNIFFTKKKEINVSVKFDKLRIITVGIQREQTFVHNAFILYIKMKYFNGILLIKFTSKISP